MEFHDEALRAWRQAAVGTAATPPAEFITAFGIQKLAEAIAELTESVIRMEGRISKLEGER